MKLGRINLPGPDGPIARLVVVQPERNRVIDLCRAETLRLVSRGATPEGALRLAAAAFPGSMAQALSSGDCLLESADRAVSARGDDASFAIEGLSWLPASDPPMLRDGLTFKKHITNFFTRMKKDLTPAMLKIPGFAKNSPAMVIGHEAEVRWPGYINQMDYELELGYVIGRRGGNLRPEIARDYLFGITIYNDFSGRDLQANELPILMGATKSKDFAHGIGPWITTLDEFDRLDNISMEVRVNGETWGKGNSSGTLWTPEELISYVSLGEMIQPGDVIGSGTMGGGSALELGRQLSPGDVVELEVGGVGVLRNVMGPKEEGLWWPTERENFMAQ